MLYGQNVSKHDFDTNIADDKKKYEISKYICLDCKLCFTVLKIYQLNSNGEFILMKTEKNLDEEYNGNYWFLLIKIHTKSVEIIKFLI